MRIRRAVFTASPLKGDYVLSPSGLTWNVRRSNGDGSAQGLFDGERDRRVALSHVVSLADGDETDAWETAGVDSFSLIARYRPSPADEAHEVK